MLHVRCVLQVLLAACSRLQRPLSPVKPSFVMYGWLQCNVSRLLLPAGTAGCLQRFSTPAASDLSVTIAMYSWL
jgi:hypothetical protein